MLGNALKQLNWVDVVAIIILLRIGYVALATGLFLEFFKLLGTILAVYLALHYHVALADFIAGRIGIKSIPLELLSFFSFIALAISGYLFFRLLRGLFAKFIKVEPSIGLDKWGGFLLGLARAILTISLVIFMLAIAPSVYLKKSAKDSFSGKDLVNVSCSLYGGLWNGVMSKFMAKEKFNQGDLEAQKSLGLKK